MTPDELEALFVLDAEPGPAKRADSDANDAIVGGALAALRETPRGPAAARPAPSRLVHGLAAGLVLGFVLAGGVAAALWQSGVFEPTEPETAPRSTAPAASAERAVVDERAAMPEPEREPEQEVAQEPPPGERPAEARPTPPAPDHADLLAAASQARGRRDYRRAARLYARVAQTRGPGAYAAAVAAAELELEHLGHPARAQRLFRRARRIDPGGPLDAQIGAGLTACETALP